MSTDTPASVEPRADPMESMRHRLDLLNKQFMRVTQGLETIDSALAAAISDHLDAIGLDDINRK